MRVIAGTARGRRLAAPPGERVRPTLDRVREALFNILAHRIEGAAFLDLFAGSGANGIEALSRGAVRVVFLDNHPESVACIQKNLEITQLGSRALCMRSAIPQDLARLSGSFDLIFADPPYGFTGYAELLETIARNGTLAQGGEIIIEHPRKLKLPEDVGTLRQTQTRHYGSSALSFYA